MEATRLREFCVHSPGTVCPIFPMFIPFPCPACCSRFPFLQQRSVTRASASCSWGSCPRAIGILPRARSCRHSASSRTNNFSFVPAPFFIVRTPLSAQFHIFITYSSPSSPSSRFLPVPQQTRHINTGIVRVARSLFRLMNRLYPLHALSRATLHNTITNTRAGRNVAWR
jgi:hypothetical protein